MAEKMEWRPDSWRLDHAINTSESPQKVIQQAKQKFISSFRKTGPQYLTGIDGIITDRPTPTDEQLRVLTETVKSSSAGIQKAISTGSERVAQMIDEKLANDVKPRASIVNDIFGSFGSAQADTRLQAIADKLRTPTQT